MKSGVLGKVTELGVAAVQFGGAVEHVKEAVAGGVEDGFKEAKRAVKQGRRAAEDLVDDAEYHVKRYPFSTVGVCFGIGLGLGAVIGMLLARNANHGK